MKQALSRVSFNFWDTKLEKTFSNAMNFIQLNLERIHIEIVVVYFARRLTLTSNKKLEPTIKYRKHLNSNEFLRTLVFMLFGWCYCDMHSKTTITTQSKNKKPWEIKQNKKEFVAAVVVCVPNEQLRSWFWLCCCFFFDFSCLPAPLTSSLNTSKFYRNEISHHAVIDFKVLCNIYYHLINLPSSEKIYETHGN